MARSASARVIAIGFSTKTALPACGRRDDEVGVGRARARDGDGLDARVVDERLRVGEPLDAERLAEAFGSGGLDVGDGDELGLTEAARQGGGVVGADAAGSDEPEADGVGARHDCSFAGSGLERSSVGSSEAARRHARQGLGRILWSALESRRGTREGHDGARRRACRRLARPRVDRLPRRPGRLGGHPGARPRRGARARLPARHPRQPARQQPHPDARRHLQRRARLPRRPAREPLHRTRTRRATSSC